MIALIKQAQTHTACVCVLSVQDSAKEGVMQEEAGPEKQPVQSFPVGGSKEEEGEAECANIATGCPASR